MTWRRVIGYRLRGLFAKLSPLFRRQRAEADLDAEFSFHLEQRVKENIRAGMDATEARRQASISFGGVERYREEVRDTWGINSVEALLKDVRFALRRLRNRPLFTFTALITLGFGLGANTAVFSIFYAVLLRPLPFVESDELVHVWDASQQWGLSEPELIGLQGRNRTLEDLVGYVPTAMNLQGPQGPARISVVVATPNIFSVLGAFPALGTVFPADAGQDGQVNLVILSHALWQQEFGADPGVIGTDIWLDESPVTVFGVMPRNFDFPVDGGALAWLPLPIDRANPAGSFRYLRTVARKQAAVTDQLVTQDLNQLNVSLREEILERFPGGANITDAFHVVPLRDQILGDFRGQLLLLMGAVGLVLMMVCANMSTLLLGEAQHRQRDVAMQLAVGASRGFVVRGLLVESAVLCIGGGIAGVLTTVWATKLLARFAGGIVPLAGTVEVSVPVLCFAMALAVMVSVLIGLAPALRASSLDILTMLKGPGDDSRQVGKTGRMRGGLVTVQVALSLVLLVGAAMLVKSFWNLRQVELGFDPERVLAIGLTPPQERFADPSVVTSFYQGVEERVRSLPGVQRVSATTIVPLDGAGPNSVFGVEGSGAPWDGSTLAYFQIIDRDYFQAIGATILEGREFDRSDTEDGLPVVILNNAAARAYWPTESAVGRRLQLWPDEPWLTVVGIVGDVRSASLEGDPLPRMYLPRGQSAYVGRLGSGIGMDVVIRTSNDPLALVPLVRAAVSEVDANVPIATVRTLEQIVSSTTATWRLLGSLFGMFAIVALLLAVVGVYGVTACLIGTRTPEFALRLALGATRQSVTRLALVRSARMAFPGIAIGVGGAIAGGYYLSTILYEAKTTDGPILILAAVVLGALALLSSYLPARKAAQMDPMGVLAKR